MTRETRVLLLTVLALPVFGWLAILVAAWYLLKETT